MACALRSLRVHTLRQADVCVQQIDIRKVCTYHDNLNHRQLRTSASHGLLLQAGHSSRLNFNFKPRLHYVASHPLSHAPLPAVLTRGLA
eukprot:3749380-Pleurochrysis_carterae.AAC.1